MVFVRRVTANSRRYNSHLENKQAIIEYLKTSDIIAACASVPIDVFTGERIPQERLAQSDGEFNWLNDNVYYYEKYDIEIPEDFLKHIEEKITSLEILNRYDGLSAT